MCDILHELIRMLYAPNLEPALLAVLIQFETNNTCHVRFYFYFIFPLLVSSSIITNMKYVVDWQDLTL